jgi:hypothetical protein
VNAAEVAKVLDGAGGEDQLDVLREVFAYDNERMFAWLDDPSFDLLGVEARHAVNHSFGYFQGAADMFSLKVVDVVRAMSERHRKPTAEDWARLRFKLVEAFYEALFCSHYGRKDSRYCFAVAFELAKKHGWEYQTDAGFTHRRDTNVPEQELLVWSMRRALEVCNCDVLPE